MEFWSETLEYNRIYFKFSKRRGTFFGEGAPLCVITIGTTLLVQSSQLEVHTVTVESVDGVVGGRLVHCLKLSVCLTIFRQ